jgi:thiol-disulfide isomerase/thioredoxin
MVTFRRLLVFLCLGSACFAQHTPRKVADVGILSSDGKTIRIPHYLGKVVMIEFMRVDCPPCFQTIQLLSRLQTELGARGFQAVAVSLDEDGGLVKPFAERYRFPFPVGHLDPLPAIKLMDLNATAHPTVPYIMFVDWQGSVRFEYPGNAPIFNDAQKNLHDIAGGLVHEAEEKRGPIYKTVPAVKQ